MTSRIVVLLVIFLLVGITAFTLINNRSDEGSLTDVSIAPTPTGIILSPSPKGNEAMSLRKTDEDTLTYTLFEQNNSGVAGTINIKEEDSKTVVTVNVINGKGDHPAHFHSGTCREPGEIIYSLHNVKNGISQTSLSASREKFKEKLPLILNVHKSQKEISTYISCSEITDTAKVEAQ